MVYNIQIKTKIETNYITINFIYLVKFVNYGCVDTK